VEIWTATDVESVIGECTRAIPCLGKLLQTTSSAPAPDVVAWGQYLDAEHGGSEHWGLYGTAAGAQILSERARAAGGQPSEQPLVAGALRLLPEDPDHGHALLVQKRDKDDFENVIKLAAVAEALRPDDPAIPRSGEPAIVGRLRGAALADGGWSSRPEGAEQREIRERDLATAYVLYAWRRYELGPEGLAARRWLARAVLESYPIEGPDLLALAGLALCAHPPDPNDPAHVAEAIEAIAERLTAWADSRGEIRVDRPMFSGFSVGTTTDYLFLHPEILTAFFFLGRDNPPQTRGFVIEVAQALAANVNANEGLRVSNGLKATVDQLWAFRFLYELRKRSEGGLEKVLPPAGEEQVREYAGALFRNGAEALWAASRLALSKEAGYRRAVLRFLAVLVPIALAAIGAVLISEHPREAIVAFILALGVGLGLGYLFYFKDRGST
jgi:hypothetical protein